MPAHLLLDQLRQKAAAERIKQRDFETQFEASKANVEEASLRREELELSV